MNTIEMALAQLGANKEMAFALETAMIAGGITNQLEKAHFAAQMAHESSGFGHLEENLNYSAERLRVVFRKYFPTTELAEAYAHRPIRIGSRVYANRYGNGSEVTCDGYNYRGRGIIMLTFKDNYKEASQAINNSDLFVVHPEVVAEPNVAAAVAVWFWNKKKCGEPARQDDIRAVTFKINGGYNGLEDRKQWLVRAKQAFNLT
jgi:putative chitinase